MAEPRRAPMLVVAALVLIGALLAGPRTSSGGPVRAALPPATVGPVPAAAVDSSWSCAGATAGPSSTLPGELIFDNAGRRPVTADTELVASDGAVQRYVVVVAAGRASRLAESVTGAASGSWVSALVTLYGGLASVSQYVGRAGTGASSLAPCVPTPSASWYFPWGTTAHGSAEYISLVNPYPVAAIADLSFTTELGQEGPAAYQGVVVPADGLTVLALNAHLQLRQHVATSVVVRAGQVVAFETQLLGRSGLISQSGAPSALARQWWPGAGNGAGLIETYDIYNPDRQPAQADLQVTGGGQDQVSVAPLGWAQVTTNSQPWAPQDQPYMMQISSRGAGLVVDRAQSDPESGAPQVLALGLSSPAASWALPSQLSPSEAAVIGPPLPAASAQGATGTGAAQTVQVVDTGHKPTIAHLEVAGGRRPGVGTLQSSDLLPGRPITMALPAGSDVEALTVSAGQPLLAQEGLIAALPVSP